MEYLYKIDVTQLSEPSNTRLVQSIVNLASDAGNCSVTYVRTPAGSGSKAGLHSHTFDQMFYLLSGIMNVEIAGKEYYAEPGTLIIFPAGIPHRNWNLGPDPNTYLSFKIGIGGSE